jgi:hypothetical protein
MAPKISAEPEALFPRSEESGRAATSLQTNFLIWIYCKPLKSHKSAKGFLEKTSGNLEILG